MNWIERLPEIKNKDLYSQNGEGLILEYIFSQVGVESKAAIDIGSGDGFILSNTRHLFNLGWHTCELEKKKGNFITSENILTFLRTDGFDLVSIDTDGNDYWILDALLDMDSPRVIVAEFNPAFLDARTIAYNPDHVWAGDNYYGFSFEAGKKLAEKHGYKVIFQLADMNMFMVRADLIEGLTFPEVRFKQNNFFKESNRTDWVFV